MSNTPKDNTNQAISQALALLRRVTSAKWIANAAKAKKRASGGRVKPKKMMGGKVAKKRMYGGSVKKSK